MAWSNLRLRILFALGFFVQHCFEDNTDVMFNINTSFEFIEVLVFSCTRKEPFFNLPPPFHNNISFYILCTLHKITMKWKLFFIHDATASFDHYLTYKISYLVSFKYNMISFKKVIILNQEDQNFLLLKVQTSMPFIVSKYNSYFAFRMIKIHTWIATFFSNITPLTVFTNIEYSFCKFFVTLQHRASYLYVKI